ncbi:cytochrome b [Nymphaea thermarum]|nr:cytochrome b [Nymphaea thermarum]
MYAILRSIPDKAGGVAAIAPVSISLLALPFVKVGMGRRAAQSPMTTGIKPRLAQVGEVVERAREWLSLRRWAHPMAEVVNKLVVDATQEEALGNAFETLRS